MINFLLISAFDVSAIAYWTWIVLKVAIGLGAVIFVHELGHFLVAKACGVKCEKFFIGFDIGGYKISRKWGETEYGVGILPLGGYVKMLGQDDDPAHIAEQMQKSQINAESPNAVQITGPRGEKYFVDHRSYLAKSVPQRMAIISAGVIMNVIFAFIFATVAYGMGVPYEPSIVSGTMPGSPAFEKNLEADDAIEQFGKYVQPTFNQLKGSVTLGDQDKGIYAKIRRAATGEVEEMWLKPDQGRGRLATIGISGPKSLSLYKKLPFAEDSPAAKAKLIAPSAGEVSIGEPKLQSGDKIVRIDDTDVHSYRDFAAYLARNPDRAIRITVLRTDSDTKSSDSTAKPRSQELTFEVSPQPMQRFGLVMKMGRVTSIQEGSASEAAGLKIGDVIEKVDGQAMAGVDGSTGTWDPVTLPELLRQAAIEGRNVELIVLRSDGDGKQENHVTLRLTPRVPINFLSELPERVPMGALAAGFAYRIENEVVAVRPNTPAAAADIRPGDTIVSAKIFLPKDDKGKTPEPTEVEINKEKPNVPAIATGIHLSPPGTEVEFKIARPDVKTPHSVKLRPTAAENFHVAERGFVFEPIREIRTAQTLSEQIQYGWDETTDALLMVYRFLQKIGGQVPVTALGGPITIAQVAGSEASKGLPSLLIFLTMLSANLAVINFLPIPLLDGGHMVFLAYEGIRGRPANERFVVAMHMIGFAFIVTLMLFVLGLDLRIIPRNL